jgi:hypothetical protein
MPGWAARIFWNFFCYSCKNFMDKQYRIWWAWEKAKGSEQEDEGEGEPDQEHYYEEEQQEQARLEALAQDHASRMRNKFFPTFLSRGELADPKRSN